MRRINLLGGFVLSLVFLLNASCGIVLPSRGLPEKQHPWPMDMAQKRLHENPQDPEAHLCLADVLEYDKQYESALREYRTGLKLGADAATTRFEIGVCLNAQGKRAEAREEWKKVLQLVPPMMPQGCAMGDYAKVMLEKYPATPGK